MRTYISFKYSFISLGALALCFIFLLVGFVLIAVAFFGFLQSRHFDFFFLVPLVLAYTQYPIISSRIIFIEDKKIVAKGIFKTQVFEIADFKKVGSDWWGIGGNFRMYFNDGTNFRFYPSNTGGPYFFNKEISNEINAAINALK